MSNEVAKPKTRKSAQPKRAKRTADAKAAELDSRRKLEERLEDMRLQQELKEFDFEY